MVTQWTFKGVKRVADTEPVAAKQEAPVISIGKKNADGQQAEKPTDKPKEIWGRKQVNTEDKKEQKTTPVLKLGTKKEEPKQQATQ